MTTERPVQVNVVKVKKSDKGDFYKRQTAWALRDLAVVDAKDAVKVCVTFFWVSAWFRTFFWFQGSASFPETNCSKS